MGLMTNSNELARLVSPDALTALRWSFDEAGPPFANSGAAGVLPLTAGGGTAAVFGRGGVFGQCVDFGGAVNGMVSGNTQVGETAGPWTASAWVKVRAFPAQFPHVLAKQYRNDGTWTSPFSSVDIQLTNAADGSWQALTTIDGSPKVIAVGGNDKVILNQWHHLALSFDGTNLIAYKDGDVVGSLVTTLPAPVQSALTTAAGGTLAAATYFYKVTALNANGETVGSNEQSIATPLNNKNTVSWAAVGGATNYRVYRGTAAGAENVFYAVGNVTSFVDTGAASTAGAPPASNTATGVSTDWGTHGAWIVGGNPLATTEDINAKIDEVRFDWALRSAAYIRGMYKAGLALFD